jgi:hypothetical protein
MVIDGIDAVARVTFTPLISLQAPDAQDWARLRQDTAEVMTQVLAATEGLLTGVEFVATLGPILEGGSGAWRHPLPRRVHIVPGITIRDAASAERSVILHQLDQMMIQLIWMLQVHLDDVQVDFRRGPLLENLDADAAAMAVSAGAVRPAA